MNRLCVAAGVTLAFTAMWADSAFVVNQQPTTAPEVLQARRSPMRSAVPAAPERMAASGHSSGLGVSACAGAVLLWVAAALPARLVKNKPARKVQVVGLQAMPVYSAPVPQQVAVAASVPEPVAPVALPALPSLLGEVVPEIAAKAEPTIVHLPSVEPQLVTEVKTEATPASAEPVKLGFPTRGPARFVGGARRAEFRQASTGASASRAARRAVGAKLQPACEHVTIPPSYEASVVRAPIQTGLRIEACIRTGRGRQVKTPPAVKSFMDEEGGLLRTALRHHHHQQHRMMNILLIVGLRNAGRSTSILILRTGDCGANLLAR